MGYSVDIGGDGPFALATAKGWREFSEWVADLPDSCPELRALVEEGCSESSEAVAAQLRAALEAWSPKASVRSTAQSLLELIGVGAPDETVSVVH